MFGFRSRGGMLRIFCTNGASTSVTKLFDFGGTDLACCLPLKFDAVNASVHKHFNQERHLYSQSNFKLNRAAALTEWRCLCAA
jgi:hypothetical protein